MGFSIYPETLPKGSGNHGYDDWASPYYDMPNQQILMEGKGNISPAEEILSLRYLNRLMAKLAAQGYDVGYTRVSDLDSVPTVPDGVILAMVKNLAQALWSQFNTDSINQLLDFSAKRTLKTMAAFSVNIDRAAQFPNTFPIGSGNDYGIYVDRFYSDPERKTQVIVSEDNEQLQH